MPLPRSLFPLTLLALTACTNHSLSPPDTLTVELEGPTQTINPLYTMDTNSQHVNELVHAPLVVTSRHLTPEPYLAEEFHRESPTSVFFRLKQGCKLESGAPLNADAVKNSLAYFLDPKNESTLARSGLDRIKKFEKLSDLTFRLTTDRPSPSLLTDLEYLKVLDLTNVTPGTKPTFLRGAGPYKVISFAPGEIHLERSGQPCLPTPQIAKISIKVVRDDLSRFLKLKRGELDLVLNDMNYRKVEYLLQHPELPIAAQATDSAHFVYMGLNQSSAALKDPRVRLALAKSFDIPEIIRYKSRGFAKPSRGMLADMNFYSNPKVPYLTRDLEGARRLLDEAGYSNGTNGKPALHLTLKTSGGIISVENARVLSAQAREAGIVIEHRPYDFGVFFADVKSGNTELYNLMWTGVSDPHLYYDLFHSSQIGKNNRTHYQSAEMDKLLEEGDASLDPAKRRAAYDQVQELAARDLPFINLWHPQVTAVYRKNIQGVEVHPLGTWRVILAMRKE
jgi:peptide/nickel transport system substrate-binding protein